MISKKALERLKFIADKELNIGSKSYNDLQEFWNYKEPLKVIEELAERDTPKKVRKSSNPTLNIAFCPKCRHILAFSYNGCPYCLQRLDWGERK